MNTGTVELAPLSAIDTSLLATGGLVVGDPLLAIIHTNGGTLDVGGFTNVSAGATAPVASASSVSVGPANLTGIASTLRLNWIGPITQTTGPLVVTNLTGSAGPRPAWPIQPIRSARLARSPPRQASLWLMITRCK